MICNDIRILAAKLWLVLFENLRSRFNLERNPEFAGPVSTPGKTLKPCWLSRLGVHPPKDCSSVGQPGECRRQEQWMEYFHSWDTKYNIPLPEVGAPSLSLSRSKLSTSCGNCKFWSFKWVEVQHNLCCRAAIVMRCIQEAASRRLNKSRKWGWTYLLLIPLRKEWQQDSQNQQRGPSERADPYKYPVRRFNSAMQILLYPGHRSTQAIHQCSINHIS